MVGNTALQKPSVLLAVGVLEGGGEGTPPTPPVVSDPDYQAVINRGFALGYTLPSVAIRTAQNDLVIALKAAGIWTELDLLYIFVGDGDLNFACLNWKTPASFQCTPIGSPTVTPLVGIPFNGTTQYLNTNWSPENNGVKFTLNGASFGVHIFTNLMVDSIIDIGSSDGGSTPLYMNARATSDAYAARVNTITAMTGSGLVPNSIGLYHNQRTASNAQRALKNSVQLVTSVGVSTARPVAALYVGANNTAGVASAFCARTFSMAFTGASLTGLEASLFTTWNEYLATIAYKRIIDYASAQSFTLPSPGVQTNQRALIKDLMNNHIWNQMDIFYNYITDGDLNFSCINWKNPGSFQCTVVGNAPVLTPNLGVQFDASGHFDTGWKPGTDASVFAQNDASVFIHVLSTAQSANYDYGCSASADGIASGIVLNSSTTTGTATARTNSNTTLSLVSGKNEGFWHVRRTASNANSAVRNAATLSSDVVVSTAKPNFNMYIGASNGNNTAVGRSARRYGMFAAGASMSSVSVMMHTIWMGYVNPYRAAAAYQAILDYATTQSFTAPTSATQTLQLAFIRALMDQGLWDYLDCLYVAAMDGGSLGFSYINWKTPGTFQATASAPPTLTNKVGWTFNGTSQFVDTNWRPNATQSFLTNDAGYGIHIATNTAFTAIDCGCTSNADGTTASTAFGARTTLDQVSARINSTTGLSPASTDSRGFFHVKRTGANDMAVYKAGVSISTSAAAASVSRTPQDMFIGATNGNGTALLFSNRAVSMFWAGASCSLRELTFYNAWNTYFTAVSV